MEHMETNPASNFSAVKEQSNAKGVLTRPLFVKHLEWSAWRELGEIMARENLKSVADGIRFCISKAAGKS